MKRIHWCLEGNYWGVEAQREGARMCLIAYATRAVVTALKIPSGVLACVVVATWAMANTVVMAMATLINGLVVNSILLNIIVGCIFQ